MLLLRHDSTRLRHASAGYWHRRDGAIVIREGVSIPRRHSVGRLHKLKTAPRNFGRWLIAAAERVKNDPLALV